jgi:hypothetical protein
VALVPRELGAGGAATGTGDERVSATELERAELERELARTVDELLALFERCEELELPAIPIILDRLQGRGVELPPWVAMMV